MLIRLGLLAGGGPGELVALVMLVGLVTSMLATLFWKALDPLGV